MPVPLIYRFSRAITFDNKPVVYLVAAGLILLAIRVWSSSSSLRVRRVLHGKTIVISVRQPSVQLHEAAEYKSG